MRAFPISRCQCQFPALMLLLGMLAIPSLTTAADGKYALLVGVTEYRHAEMNKPPLDYPEIDAKAVSDFLKQHGYEVDLLLGKQATREAVLKKLEVLGQKGTQKGAVVVGFWGHGVEFEGSDEAMFCPYDTSVRLAADSKGRELYDKEFKRLIEPNPETLIGMSKVLNGLKITGAGNRLLLADCCRNSPNRPRGRAFGSKLKLTDLPDNTAAIFACSSSEQAFEHKDWGHGAMTKCLLDLLPRLTSDGGDVNSITGRLRMNVSALVSAQSGGRDSQTVHPLVNGVVELRLEMSIQLLVAPFSALEAANAQKLTARALGVPETVKNSIGMELKLIPAGEFRMGSGKSAAELARIFDSKAEYFTGGFPQHRVRLTKAFRMGTTEVTQGQWEEVMRTKPWSGKPEVKEGANYAASYVSWDDAQEFCRKLSAKDGATYRLPTEAEWEYSCRAGSMSLYGYGDSVSSLKEYAWCKENALRVDEAYPHEVGRKRANNFGLSDMHGNVTEFCEDWYDEYGTRGALTINPTAVKTGKQIYRISRGGSYALDAMYDRSAKRSGATPNRRSEIYGFRVVLP